MVVGCAGNWEGGGVLFGSLDTVFECFINVNISDWGVLHCFPPFTPVSYLILLGFIQLPFSTLPFLHALGVFILSTVITAL